MAFDPDGLSDVAALNRGRTLFEYGTRDSLATVLAAGYFDAAHGLLTTGDSILVSADDGEAIVRAAIVNGGAVVAVSQGGAGTANLGFAANELGPGTVERTLASDLLALGVPVTRFGALGTAVELSDVVSTASSAVLTSPSGGFASAQVGDLIEIDGIGAVATKFTSSVLRTGTMGAPVSATIIAKASSTQVTISSNATTTASGCRCVYGPDEFDAFAAAAASALVTKLLIPPGKYILRTGTVLTLQSMDIEAAGATIVCGDIYVGSNVKIRGGSWYDRAGMSASGLFTLGPTNIWTAGTISRVQFRDTYISWQKCEIGINSHHCSTLRIEGCEFYERNSLIDPDGGAPVAITGGNDVKILNNTMVSAREGDDGIAGSCYRGNVSNVEIAGNYIEGFVGAWCCNTHNFNYSVNGVHVHNNKLKNCAMIARLKPGAFDDIAPGGGILYNHDIHDNHIEASTDCWRMSTMLEIQIRKDNGQISGIDGLKFHSNTASGRWANGSAVYKWTIDGGAGAVAVGAYLHNAEIYDNKVISASKWMAPDTWLSITLDAGTVAGAEIKGLIFRNERCQYLMASVLDIRVPETGTVGEIIVDGFSCDMAMVATASTYAISLQGGAIARLRGEWVLDIPEHKRYLSLADTAKCRTGTRIRAALADVAASGAGVAYTQRVHSLPEGRCAIFAGARIFADAITRDDTNYNRYRLIEVNGYARTIVEFGAANAPVQPDNDSILTIGNATARSWDFRASGATGDESNKGSTVAATAKNLVDGLNASASPQLTVATYYQLVGQVEGKITLDAAPSDGDTVTVNGVAFTFKTTPTLASHVQIGVNNSGTPTAVASAIWLVEKLRASTDPALTPFLYIREGAAIRVVWASDDWATGETKTLSASVATVSSIIAQYSGLLAVYDTAGTAGESFSVSPGGTTNMTGLTGGSSAGLRLFVGDLINTRSTNGGASANGAPTAIVPTGAAWNMQGVTQGSAVGALARTRARTNGCVLAVEVTRVGNGVVMTNGFVEFDILELKRAA